MVGNLLKRLEKFSICSLLKSCGGEWLTIRAPKFYQVNLKRSALSVVVILEISLILIDYSSNSTLNNLSTN